MKKIAIVLAAIGMMLASCKKSTVQPDPQVITNTVYVHDTVYVNDTIYPTPTSLQGTKWLFYKADIIISGNTSSQPQNCYVRFTQTEMLQDTNMDNTYESAYQVTYGTNEVSIYFSSTPKVYSVTTAGNEYRLTLTEPGQVTVWYLKRSA